MGDIFNNQTGYENEPFISLKRKQPGYRQVCMKAIPVFCKDLCRSRNAVSPVDEIPTARVVLMGMVIHFLVFWTA